MGVRWVGAHLAGRICEKTKRPAFGDLGIELSQAARSGVARIGENFASFRGLAFI